jgi:competence CoiA-like predicted nuclease
MLTAIHNGREITAKDAYEENIYITSPEFLDPYEKKLKVVFVNAKDKIKHFRYLPNQRPDWHIQKYGGGESERHLKAKEFIYQYYKDRGHNVAKEYEVNGQRADVVDIDKKMVYEVVLNSVTEKELYNRTIKYKEAGYITFWYIEPYLSDFDKLYKLLVGNFYKIEFINKKIAKYYLTDKYFIEI